MARGSGPDRVARRETTRRTGVAVVAMAFALAGCGGGTPAGSPTPSASGSAAAPSGAASPTANASANGTASANSICQVISVQRMSRLTGFTLGAATDSSQSGGRSCTYTPTEGAKKKDVALIIGDGRLRQSIGDAAQSARTSFGLSTISTTTVDGASAARVVTGKTSGVNTVFVIATRGTTYYSALTGGTRTTDAYSTAMRAVLAALIKG